MSWARESARTEAEVHAGFTRELKTLQAAVEVSLEVGDYSLVGYDERRRDMPETSAMANLPDWPN